MLRRSARWLCVASVPASASPVRISTEGMSPGPKPAKAKFVPRMKHLPISPHVGYVSDDIGVSESKLGGPFKRGVFAVRELPYDREIMRIPAFLYFVNDGDVRSRTLKLTHTVLERYAKAEIDSDERHYIDRRVLTMMSGTMPIFAHEDECRTFLKQIPEAWEAYKRKEFDLLFVQKLAMAIEFNRTDVDYRGHPGSALFPEMTLLNHSCEANAKLVLSKDPTTGARTLQIRTLFHIPKDGEVLIDYLDGVADEDMPLTRKNAFLMERWGFECGCYQCRSRLISAMLLIALGFIVVAGVPCVWYLNYRAKAKGL
jgi:hypothetical protein